MSIGEFEQQRLFNMHKYMYGINIQSINVRSLKKEFKGTNSNNVVHIPVKYCLSQITK